MQERYDIVGKFSEMRLEKKANGFVLEANTQSRPNMPGGIGMVGG